MGKTEIDRRLDALRLGEWSREGEFVGQNIMGKVLMVCRDALRAGTTPAIDLELLRKANINFFGTVLTFTEVPSVGAEPKTALTVDSEPEMVLEYAEGDRVYTIRYSGKVR